MKNRRLSPRLLLKYLLSTLMLWALLAACNESKMVDQECYIPVDQSRLYMRLAGNANGPVIIMLHGGPGAFSGFDRAFYKGTMEPDYLIGYLDQRGGGKSDECPDSSMLTMEQFVADLDVVIDSIRLRYPGRNINLLGSSWGGTYGLLYLLAHPGKITALACVSGKADSHYEYRALIGHETRLATEQLAQVTDSARADTLKQMLTALEAIKMGSFDQFYEKINLLKYSYPKVLGFNPYWFNLEAKAAAVRLGKDPEYYNCAHYTRAEFDSVMRKGAYVNRVFRNTPDYNNLNILNQLSKITTPVAVIEGKYDYVVGPKQGQMIFNALTGLDEHKKELVIIDSAAHNLNMEAPDAYFTSLKQFFEEFNS